jgi:hypothetical protein
MFTAENPEIAEIFHTGCQKFCPIRGSFIWSFRRKPESRKDWFQALLRTIPRDAGLDPGERQGDEWQHAVKLLANKIGYVFSAFFAHSAVNSLGKELKLHDTIH